MNTPDQYTVIGNPIAHSKSPMIHQAFARQTDQHMTYSQTLGCLTHFAEDVRVFIDAGGKGLNVTVPFKQQAFDLADTLSTQAEAAGAVNTLSVQADGTLFGDNTDGVGLVRDLQHNHGIALADKHILLIGAGGAARGVLHPLLACQPASIRIANRNPDKAQALAQLVATPQVIGCGLSEIPAQPFDLLINATAASLQGQIPAIPASAVGADSQAYDMLYSPEPTAFMRWASQQGARQVMDGLGMLVEQAAASFYQWRGVRPDTAPVLANMTR